MTSKLRFKSLIDGRSMDENVQPIMGNWKFVFGKVVGFMITVCLKAYKAYALAQDNQHFHY